METRMIKSDLITRVLASRSKYSLWKTLIVLLIGMSVNLLILYFIRRFNSRDKGGRHRHRRSSKGSSRSDHKRRNDGKTKSNDPNVLLLLGIPGSGKTTWMTQYLERCDHSYTIVSAEALRIKLTGKPDDFSREEEVRESMINDVVNLLKEKHNVVLDDSLSAMDETFRRRIVDESPTCNRYVKSFPIKAIFARPRLLKDIAEGKIHLCPSKIELEEMEIAFDKAQELVKKEGWQELMESTYSHSKRSR
ncbi:putative retrotransposon hot spot (RHS) protein [Trypanosoma theileri]|uniref:Putative retrotransposon hot spot (RHS) protein n=1 Tax=Trypanosoma theileri TaxID=67003 RepID=A0A1X0P9V1_9TRYP|nr:putative retrotransposon hot spot (RHS) protein [Trypanosoma theileri]ORC93712.1 putative retrotransposon hot spot (RHS) protein [Trypanosoma theileri]